MAKNFAQSLVATAPSPATTGTSLVVTGGEGTKFPAAPFQATIWPAGLAPTTSNAEIVTITGVSTDTLTIVRAQEGSSARSVIVGDQIAATVTAGVVVQSHRYDPLTAALQDITLDRSTDFAATDTFEVGSAYSLEVPATSTLEPVPTVKQAEVQSYFGLFDFIESGCVWSADSAGSSLNGTMTDGYVWINGRRLRVNCVRSRAFTASTDTYVDFSDNGDGTAKLNYTETTNNAATGSPALSAGRLRNAIIVTAAGSIAAATSINQGQETMVLPIVASLAYSKTDSLGNIICPRDPQRRLLGIRQIISSFILSGSQTTSTAVTGLSVPVIVPTGRQIKVSAYTYVLTGGANNTTNFELHDGSVNGFTNQIQGADAGMAGTAVGEPANPSVVVTPTATSKTYVASVRNSALANATVSASSSAPYRPAYIMVELL